jgi:hypothetical protein
MPVLKSLSFTAIPKTANAPVQTLRAKFVSKLEEQKLLLKSLGTLRLYDSSFQLVNGLVGTAKPSAQLAPETRK